MVTHLARTRPGPFGGTLNTSLCGRLNAATRDGMNVTTERAAVTCKFCLRRMEADANRAALR